MLHTIPFLLCLVAQSCPTFCYSWTIAHQAPLSLGILQPRIVEWVAMSSSPTQGSYPVLPHCRQILYHLSQQGSPFHSYSLIINLINNYLQIIYLQSPLPMEHLSLVYIFVSETFKTSFLVLSTYAFLYFIFFPFHLLLPFSQMILVLIRP